MTHEELVEARERRSAQWREEKGKNRCSTCLFLHLPSHECALYKR